MRVNIANTDYLFGLFNGDHMEYNLLADHAIEPTLTEMTTIAIEILKKNSKGYLILVEGKFIVSRSNAFFVNNRRI